MLWDIATSRCPRHPINFCKIAGLAARSLLLAGGALASSIRNDLAPNRLCRFGAVVVAAIAYESGTLNALVATTTTAPLCGAVVISNRVCGERGFATCRCNPFSIK